MLRYIELKSGFSDNGPAWVARVKMSKSGRTLYFNGRALLATGGRHAFSNYIDIESRETYWVSGVKKNGQDRHWAGSGIVRIEASAVSEYLACTERSALPRHIQIIADLPAPSPAAFEQLQHQKLYDVSWNQPKDGKQPALRVRRGKPSWQN